MPLALPDESQAPASESFPRMGQCFELLEANRDRDLVLMDVMIPDVRLS